MSQRWRAFGNTVSDLTSSKFEPQTSYSRNERVIASPTGRFAEKSTNFTEGSSHLFNKSDLEQYFSN